MDADSNNIIERTELLDIMLYVAESALLWFLILLATIRVLVSWFFNNLTSCGLRVCRIGIEGLTKKMSEATEVFLACFWQVYYVLSSVPRTIMTIVFKLSHLVHSIAICCLILCQSLHKDDLCTQVGRGGKLCLTWTRRLCFCRSLCSRVSIAAHHVCQICFRKFQSFWPTFHGVFNRLRTAVVSYGAFAYLRYVSSNICGVLVEFIRQAWPIIVGIYQAVAGNQAVSHDATGDTRRSWGQTYPDLWHIQHRLLGCPASMTRWRIPHFRCSPRSGFYAILVFVAFTFLLTTYLYSGRFVNVTGQAKHVRLQILQRHDDSAYFRARLLGQDDELANPLKIRKNQHRRKDQPDEEEWRQLSTPGMKQVLDVINLMSRQRSANETSTLGYQKQVLRRQIRLLREAMTSELTMLPKSRNPPACVGNLQPGEVEDILCIPRPKYLGHIKNPCWYSEKISDNGEKALHCLPYFHILGCAKSGTTDLWNRLMSHPHTVSNDGLLHKEALWWSWYRYGISGYNRNRQVQNFSDYVNLFQDTARQIQSSIDKETLFHQILITGDASPPDFWDFRGWTNISQNRQYSIPVVTTPHLMRHIYANPKFIIMFREPIDRLYSDYFFVGLGLTAQDFHNDIMASVNMLATCVEKLGLQHCFFNHDLYVKLPVRLPFACYSVFMREWLQLFPLESFLLIKTEEYEKNPEVTLKSVMEFLGLGPLKDTQLQVIAEEERSRVTIQRQIAGPMMNATRIILEELLGVCNTQLARLIKSDKFSWNT